MTTVSAQTTVSVGGVSLTRATTGNAGNSGPAVKTWVNARISIAPNATNAVGEPHTFTVTLEVDPGTGTFGPAAGEHVDVTLTDSNGAAHTAPTGSCTNAGANTNAAGQCTITFSSPSAGQVTAHATSTLSVNGSAPFTVATDGTAGNSGDAVKTFVNANIQINPPTATNPVGTTHVLTITVNAINGTLAAGTATASIVSGPGSFVGSPTCNYAGGGADCQLHRDDHLVRGGHDGRLRDLEHLGRRRVDHADHQHRGQHRGRRQRERPEDLGVAEPPAV